MLGEVVRTQSQPERRLCVSVHLFVYSPFNQASNSYAKKNSES